LAAKSAAENVLQQKGHKIYKHFVDKIIFPIFAGCLTVKKQSKCLK
jgi:hypothetical protein